VISPSRRPLAGNTQHSQETDTSAPAEFETAIPATARPQTHAFDRVATGIGYDYIIPTDIVLAKGFCEYRSEPSGPLKAVTLIWNSVKWGNVYTTTDGVACGLFYGITLPFPDNSEIRKCTSQIEA
jgi:hypothetical protein